MLALRPQSPLRSSSATTTTTTSSPLARPSFVYGDNDDDDNIVHASPLLPPKAIDDGFTYARTPSLTSSYTSISSADSPPNTVRPSSMTTSIDHRPKPSPIDSLIRNQKSVLSDAVLVDSPTTMYSISPSSSPAPPSRPRPSRSPMPSAFNNRPSPMRTRSQERLAAASPASGRPSRPTRRSASSGFLLDGHQSWLVAFCNRPRILASILQYIDFSEFHALCCTSKAMRAILDEQQAREAILCRFVPGYRYGLASLPGADDIRIDIRDLEALMLAQAIPLHLYPQLAQDIVAGLPHTEASTRLQQFTNVHSRFVLLLRLRAPTLSFLSDLDDPQWRSGGFTELDKLRELTFPSPLALLPTSQTPSPRVSLSKENHAPNSPAASSSEEPPRKKRRSFLSKLLQPSPARGTPSYPRSPPLHPAGGRSDTFPAFSGHLDQRRNSVVNMILRKSSSRRLPPPAPEYTPKALKDHRRRSRVMSASLSSSWKQQYQMAALEEDQLLFTPPRPAHLRSTSLPASSAATSLSSLPRLGGSQSNRPAAPTNPLDLASSRSRAPVCRVFVPCETFTQSVLLACEGQLFTAGLWQHLRIGDVVCNLGYVPPEDAPARRDSTIGIVEPASQMGWLIFTGQSLVPYRPPYAPALNALNLPSPMYYCHLLPTFVNPRFFLAIPPTRSGGAVQLTLMPLTSSVRSPATRAGLVRVRRYAWVGRVDGSEILAAWKARGGGPGDVMTTDSNSEFFNGGALLGDGGDGWNLEWVIEAEGTKEGKAGLLQAMDPQDEVDLPQTEWEVVREKCSPGRLWLRLMIVPPETESSNHMS